MIIHPMPMRSLCGRAGRNPALRGKAIAVGGERRGIIASASYEGRKMGVYTPMPSSKAKRVCPELIIVHGDFAKYGNIPDGC